ncbi:Polyubiquitin (Fragment) [Seminavis robusta]|uniref:Polyubiquitin n=1 Tax=Seminavis robusta TaxID=568900 RepID=A0A9N8EQZ8_9STRA
MDRKKDATKPKDRPSQDLQSIGGYAPDGQTTLHIVVKTFGGGTFQAFVRPSDAILVIKKQLEVHECIPVTQQRLFFARQQLEDRCSVESYNIQDGSVLNLLILSHGYEQDFITVKTLSGLTVDIIESSNYNETIAECKSKLHNEQGIPLKDQGLFYAGNQLEDSKTLAHYNIQKGSTIHLVPLINTILVKTLTGKTITIHNFTWNDTIAEFKKKIETEQFLKTGEGIPPKDQHLVYAGIQLDYGGKTMSYRYAGIQLGDSKTLAHYKTYYNMKTGSTIRLVNREVGHVFSLICEINSMGQKAGSSKKAVREAAARVSAMIPILNEILDEDANELRPFVAVLLRNLLLFKVRSKPFVFLMRARTLREELMGLCQTMEVSMEAVRIRKKGNSPQPPPDSESSDGSVKSLAPISAATGENSEEVLLVVEIVAGRNLLIGGKHSSDPYVTVMMGEDQIHKTKHINKTKNPIYTPETESTFLLDCPATDLSRAVVSHLNLTKGTGQGMEFMVEPPNGVAKEPGDARYLLIRCRKASKADAEFLKHPHHAPKNMFPTTTKEAASSAWSFLEKQLEEAVEVVGAPPVPSPEEERAAAAEIKETKRRERTEAVLNKMRPFVAVLLRNLLLFKVRSKPFVFLMRARTLREELMGPCQTMEVSMEAVRIRKKGNSPQPPPDSESSDGSVKSLAPISAATGENSEEVLLVVEIVAGRNLLIGGKHSSDPYVTVMMGEDQIHKTKHINKTKNPIYTPETESTFLLDCPATDLSQVGGLHFIVKDWDRITNDELGRAVVSHLNLTKGTGQGMEFMVEPPNGVAKEPGDAGYLLIRCRKASKADAEFLKHPHHAPKNMFPTTTKEAASSAWSFLEKQLEEAVEVVGAPPVPSPEEERAAAAEIKETKRRERTEAVLNKMDEMQRRAAMAEELADMQAQRIQKIGRMSAAKQESSPIATATAEAMRPSSIVTSTNNVDKRREEPKQESSPIATAAGKIETEGVPGGDGGSKNTTAAAASGLPKDGTQRLKKPPDWNSLGGDMETIGQWTAILEHLKHQINPERKISQFTPIPQRYTGNRVAMKYHRTFEDCLYTTVSVMRIQSQSLGLPQPSFVSGLIRVSSQTAGGVGGLLLPLIGEMMASIIGRRHAAACVDSAISFLEALPASDGVRLDQFITKLSSTMVHMQVERAKDRTIDRVLSGLEIGVIPQSASANGTGKSIGERMRILVQTWQESIKKKARAMKLEARMTTENDPDKAAAVVHAGLIARAMVENFESMQNLKVEQTPEQAALYLLQTMNFPFNSPQQKTTPGGTTGPAAAQAIAPPQASSPTTTKSSPTAATIHTDKKKDGQTEAPPQVDLAKFLSEFQDMKEKLERLEKEKEEGWKPTEQGQNRVRRTVDRTQVLNLGVGVAATSSSSDVACSYRPDTPPEVSDQRQQLFGGLPEEQQSNTEAVLSSLNGEIQQVKERLEYVEEQSSETEALVRDHLLAADLKEMKRRVKLAKKIVRNNAVSNPQEEPSDLGFQTTTPEEGGGSYPVRSTRRYSQQHWSDSSNRVPGLSKSDGEDDASLPTPAAASKTTGTGEDDAIPIDKSKSTRVDSPRSGSERGHSNAAASKSPRDDDAESIESFESFAKHGHFCWFAYTVTLVLPYRIRFNSEA